MKKISVIAVSAILFGALLMSCGKKAETPQEDTIVVDSVIVVDSIVEEHVVLEEAPAAAPAPAKKATVKKEEAKPAPVQEEAPAPAVVEEPAPAPAPMTPEEKKAALKAQKLAEKKAAGSVQ
ncbi:MAG: hypothetical protein LBR81_01455 [Prevotellaceae bacterium]|nr:hypothetical protein [Prevotellaceae bacterium]